MTMEKLKLLGGASKWDSCGSGVKRRERSTIPQELQNIIYDCASTGEDCRLMKVLQSNSCVHDCKYCVNGKAGKKAKMEPKETADIMDFLFRNKMAFGLFLSSAVTGQPETTAEEMIESARILRQEKKFPGYIHLKVLPGMPKDQINEMAKYANRLSLNVEAPSKQYLHELSSTKDYHNDLLKRIDWIDRVSRQGKLDHGFTTQLIVGAAGETDKEVLKCMTKMYDETVLKRTYFSAFQPVEGTGLQHGAPENPIREHRLYQADWLMRIYKFKPKEMVLGLGEEGNYNLRQDVKMMIAVNNPNQFPLDPNTAGEGELLKVPGIGPKAAKQIVFERNVKRRKFKDVKELKELGVITRRAQPFLSLNGWRQKNLLEFGA
jgi:predicted DNA-binding helix-hairpin-helix protein